jgi:hypothetical protein
MRYIISVVLLVASLTQVDPAAACSVFCRPQSVSEEASHSDAIFVGRVVKVTQNRTTFDVSRSWKGQVGKTFVLDNLFTECFNSHNFKLDQTYLVFARKDFLNPADKNAAPFISGTCDRQSSLAKADDDLKALDRLFGSGTKRK